MRKYFTLCSQVTKLESVKYRSPVYRRSPDVVVAKPVRIFILYRRGHFFLSISVKWPDYPDWPGLLLSLLKKQNPRTPDKSTRNLEKLIQTLFLFFILSRTIYFT